MLRSAVLHQASATTPMAQSVAPTMMRGEGRLAKTTKPSRATQAGVYAGPERGGVVGRRKLKPQITSAPIASALEQR